MEYILEVTLISPPPCSDDSLGDMGATRNDAPTDATLLGAPTYPEWPTTIEDGPYEFAGGGLSLCPAEDDWYQIPVPADSEIIAWVKHDFNSAEVGLALYDESVQAITEATGGVPPSDGLITASNQRR